MRSTSGTYGPTLSGQGRTHPDGVDRATRRRVIAASFISNFVEWFGYAVYGYLATTIAVVFFPESDRQVALLSTFALFAISFLIRPIGGFFWGRLGDRVGRRVALSWSILLMSLATFCIALIPGYATIGFWAPVLRCFSVDEPLLGVTELAARLDLHKSSVSRILSALEDEEVVEQDPHSKKYRLGLGLPAIAGPMLATLDIRRFALPVLAELSETTGETAALTVWSAAEAVVVEQVASTQLIKHTVPLGTRYTSLDSASVQVFAAEAELTFPLTEPHLAEPLAEVRTRGYAVNHAATSPDVVGIAAGARDHRGELVAALIVAAPLYRVPDDRIGELGEACAAAAADLSMRLGHRS